MKMLYIKPLLQRSVSYLSSPSRLLQTRSAVQWRIASTKPFSSASEAGENGQTVSVSPTNIEVETQGYVRIVAINRPEKRNAVNRETAKELYDVFQDFEADEGVRVGVLCGRGGTFCAGYDLSELATTDAPHEILSPFGKGPAPMVILLNLCYSHIQAYMRQLTTYTAHPSTHKHTPTPTLRHIHAHQYCYT